MIKKTPLKTKQAVEIPSPEYKDGSTFIEGETTNIKNNKAETTQTTSSENLSAKYKNPRVSQDIPSAGRGQYQ